MNTMSNHAYNVISITPYLNHPYSQNQSDPQLITFIRQNGPNQSELMKANILSVVPPAPSMTSFAHHQISNHNHFIPINNRNNNIPIMPQILYQMNHNVNNSVNIPTYVHNNHSLSTENQQCILRQCLSVKRIIKLVVFCKKYNALNAGTIAQYIDNSGEYTHLKEDYQHFMMHRVSSRDRLEMNEMSVEYEKMFGLINDIRNTSSHPVLTEGVSTADVMFLNKRMDDVYNDVAVSGDKSGINALQSVISASRNICASETAMLTFQQHLTNNPYVHNEPHCVIHKNIQHQPTAAWTHSKTCTLAAIPALSPDPGTAANCESNSMKRVKMETVNMQNVSIKYKCNECNKEYKHLCNLKSHHKVHTDEALVCPHCKKRFGRKANYNEHLRIHTGETPYQCKYCKRRFKHHHSWKDHVRIHTGENPYQCKICYKRFKVGHNLTVHLRIHTGEKPYQCKYCKKLFRQKSGLNSHIKRIHS